MMALTHLTATAWLCERCGAIEIVGDEPSRVPTSRLDWCNVERDGVWGHRWKRMKAEIAEAVDE